MIELFIFGIFNRLSLNDQFKLVSISNQITFFNQSSFATFNKSPSPAKGSRAIFAFVDLINSTICFFNQISFFVKNCHKIIFLFSVIH